MALKHVVVDGSNIATEGHSRPSLAQLDEAVSAFLDEYHPESFTVVVDATFGHRIPESERAAYEEAILAGEIVSPPAGAVGRGDAFVLKIADQASSVVFSNDSFQEFHGEYRWLFDEGRLIGGKPVPAVGWVFVTRTPVRGPTSRKATKEANAKRRSSSKTAAKLDVPKVTVPGTRPKIGDTPTTAAKSGGRAEAAPKSTGRKAAKPSNAKRPPANAPMPYLEFVETHPVGSTVTATVDRFSSHGAYVKVGDLEAYAPLKLMGDPAPRRARDVVNVGETYQFDVHGFDAPNRGVDVALIPGAVPTQSVESTDEVTSPEPTVQEDHSMAASKKSGTKKASAKKSTAKKATAKKATATKSTATKSTAKKASASKATAKKSTAKKAPAKKTTTAKSTAKKATTAKKASAAKATAKKSTAKKAPAKKATTAKKATAAKATAKKSTAKKSTAKKAPAKKATTAKKATAKKAPATKK